MTAGRKDSDHRGSERVLGSMAGAARGRRGALHAGAQSSEEGRRDAGYGTDEGTVRIIASLLLIHVQTKK